MSNFNEDTRVKIPAILHLMRLGYEYLSLKNNANQYDKETNIFEGIFKASLEKINLKATNDDISKVLGVLKQSLKNNDLGHEFYKKITDSSSDSKLKIIDGAGIDNSQ